MATYDLNQLKQIAYHLITFNNQSAKRKTEAANIHIDDFFQLSDSDLKFFGFNDQEIQKINDFPEVGENEINEAKDHFIEIIFKEDPDYPLLLNEIYLPPPFIYVKGQKNILNTKALAVVGSRKASHYGAYAVEKIIPELSRQGFVIVSGMAYGIDSLAHQQVILHHGKTVGVNAGGLLNLYPARNFSLISKILENGCVISEFPLHTIPWPYLFPVRNRIIAGMVQGILVIEAALKSGSLITAHLGLEQGKDIFAVPGRIDMETSQGTHYLIQQGAKLVNTAKDILEEYGISVVESHPVKGEISKKEKLILDLMVDYELKSIDHFADRLEIPVAEIISLLMGLILKNMIIKEAGGYRKIG